MAEATWDGRHDGIVLPVDQQDGGLEGGDGPSIRLGPIGEVAPDVAQGGQVGRARLRARPRAIGEVHQEVHLAGHRMVKAPAPARP